MKGLPVDIANEIVEKAKSKKDGVYSHKRYVYAVKRNCFVALADRMGNVYQRYGSFITEIGKVETYNRSKELKKLLPDF